MKGLATDSGKNICKCFFIIIIIIIIFNYLPRSYLFTKILGPKGHPSLLPPHQVKVKKAASRFSQSVTFYDKKFHANLKQSVAKICILGTVYTQNPQSPCKENARQH